MKICRFQMLKYSSFSFSALTMLVGQSCCSLRPQTAKCVFFPSRERCFVWIWRVLRITKSNLLYICWYDLYPFSAEAMLQVHLCLNSLKHTLELSPLKDFNSQAPYFDKNKVFKDSRATHIFSPGPCCPQCPVISPTIAGSTSETKLGPFGALQG